MTEMMWVTAVTTARTTVTQTRQIQTVTERETPVLWTLMEMVSANDRSTLKVNNYTGYSTPVSIVYHLSLVCILDDGIFNLDLDYNEDHIYLLDVFSIV